MTNDEFNKYNMLFLNNVTVDDLSSPDLLSRVSSKNIPTMDDGIKGLFMLYNLHLIRGQNSAADKLKLYIMDNNMNHIERI